jgi:hypothetical protein
MVAGGVPFRSGVFNGLNCGFACQEFPNTVVLASNVYMVNMKYMANAAATTHFEEIK